MYIMGKRISNGTAHKVSEDMRKALTSKRAVIEAWEDLTPLARNEWICWVEDAKQIQTRNHRIERAFNELMQGKSRPCCWIGCIHRKDKLISPSVQYVLGKKSKSNSKK